MRVRLRTTIAGPKLTASPGDIISLDGKLARVLIGGGYAELVSAEGDQVHDPESALFTAPEKAVSGPQKPKRKRG